MPSVSMTVNGKAVTADVETRTLLVQFLREAHVLLRRARGGTSVEAAAMRLFHGSITYLTLLFVAVGIDPLLPF